MENKLITENIDTDVLIIGGGTAGCFAAVTLGRAGGVKVLIAEKADIRRSGCLAAGVNALNAYITEGHEPQFYADYAEKDAEGIVRRDLLLSMSERLNHVTEELEKMGLVILKDENGKYAARGERNIKINGENIKPLLAAEVKKQKNAAVLNHVNITQLKTRQEAGKTVVCGALGFNVNEEIFYDIRAKAVLCASGGAAGLYRPNNPGFSRHKMWYPPFNTGAGYAMGIRAGAEMTTFEMRFIALRCKDTIAPTGTIAQGVGAKQVNSDGEIYETKYGLTTSERVWGTLSENEAGRGPCYLKTQGISCETEKDLLKAYLNMAPAQTLKWMEGDQGPAGENVEIEGSEPYVVGGHTASGYWVDENRKTTLEGLYAAGDVCGGAPQKYVTGALAEGEIAAEAIFEFVKKSRAAAADAESSRSAAVTEENFSAAGGTDRSAAGKEKAGVFAAADIPEAAKVPGAAAAKAELEAFLNNRPGVFGTDDLEEAMQKVMDEYAGGIGSNYRYNEASLKLAEKNIRRIEDLVPSLAAGDMDDLLRIYELKDRLTVCRVLIAHLAARKETRWHSFAENADYPQKSDEWLCYVNSKKENGKIKIIRRELI